jgi:transposase
LKKLTQKPSEHGRRAHAILLLWETDNCVSTVARLLRAARSSAQYWRSLYTDFGEYGLQPLRRGRSAWKASEDVLSALLELLQSTPHERGYLRSRWSSELMALEVRRSTGVAVHTTTVRRWLKDLNYGDRRARPTLCIRDPQKAQKMQTITAALADKDPYTKVFYSDEADIDLNPRIGPAWMPRSSQSAIPTPGKESKTLPCGRTQRTQWQRRVG